jgi:hypothetical protein
VKVAGGPTAPASFPFSFLLGNKIHAANLRSRQILMQYTHT